MTTTGLKAKKTKTASHRPPSEITSNTKARRAWLAEKLVEISAKPNTEAKIVGTGSYQEVSEWTITYTEGRLRHRGICQVCGRSQVVEGGVMVLHGYERPGCGYTIGRCPGVGEVPLQFSCALTVAWHLHQLDKIDELNAAIPTAEAAAEKALRAYYKAEESARRPEKPRSAWNRYVSSEDLKAYEVALAEWKKANPKTALRDATQEHASGLRTALHQAEGFADHLGELIAWRQTGTKLRPVPLRDAGLEEEVVV